MFFSQGTDVLSSEQFCSGTTELTFNNVHGGTNFTPVGCLGSIPNASYFYLQIDQPGDLIFTISQEDTFGVPIDVDFIAWGPFTDLTDANNNIAYTDCVTCPNNTANPAFYPYAPDQITDCSFDPSPTETLHILNAIQGQIYVILITNYDGDQGTISFHQSSGTGTTTCDNLPICGSNFYDTGGPTGGYFNNESYTITIYPYFPGGTVTVDFTSFDVPGADVLTAYNGPNTTSPIGTINGTQIVSSTTVGNPTGALTFEFISDGNTTGNGWESDITCAPPPTPPTCGSTFYDSGGPGGNYSNNEFTTTTFFPDTAGDAVTATFTAFNTEVNYDFLRVYDGPNNTFPQLATLTGNLNTTLPGPYTSTHPTGALTFVFTSDGSTTRAGWAANLSCAPYTPPLVCGSTFYDSGGAGGNYNSNANQTTTLFPDTAGDVITATFTSFNTEAGYDFLRVYNGPNATFPLLGTYSGTGIPGPFTSTDPTGALTFVFTSDGSITYSGWAANITCSTTTCSLTIAETLNPLGADDCSLNYSQLTATYSGGTAGTTTIFSESFNGATMPAGWNTVNATANTQWIISNTSNAGGAPREAMLDWITGTSDNGTWSLTSPIINVAGQTNLQLSFKRYLWHFSATYPYSIYIETNLDGAGWVTQSSVINVSATIAANTQNINLSALSGTNLQVRFRMTGNPFGFFYWTIDDVVITADGAPTSPITWSPINGLYTDATLSTPYAIAQQIDTVYAAPDGAQTYTATHQNSCTETVTVTRNKKTWLGLNDDWNMATNWFPTGVPTNTNCIDIQVTANNPIVHDGNDGDGKNLTIHTGAGLTLESNNVTSSYATLTIVDHIDVQGTATFLIKDGASLIQVNDFPSLSNTGNIIMERIANIRSSDYVYWSSPVNPYNIEDVSVNTPNGYKYRWIPTKFQGIGPPGNLIYGDWESYDTGLMDTGRGFIVRGPNGAPFNNTNPVDFTATFDGVPNNGEILHTIMSGSYDGANYTYDPDPTGGDILTVTKQDDNWNLIGNPYPSALNVSAFLNHPDNVSKIEGTIHLWTHGTDIYSNPNNVDSFYDDFVLNYNPSDYLSHNGTGSIPNVFDGNIASGQGFFIAKNHAVDTISSIKFSNSMRSKNYNNSYFFRTNESTPEDETERHRIWLDLIAPSEHASHTLVGYVENATLEKDRNYDGYLLNKSTGLNLYSLIGDEAMIIQGRPIPFDIHDLVPLGFTTNETGIFTFAIKEVDGLFLSDNQDIFIEDYYTNIIHDLRNSPYIFTVNETGIYNDRFVLRYTNQTLGVGELENNELTIMAPNGDYIKVKSTNSPISSVTIYDILGRILIDKKAISSSEFLLNEKNLSDGTYLVKATLENGKHKIQKVILKQ